MNHTYSYNSKQRQRCRAGALALERAPQAALVAPQIRVSLHARVVPRRVGLSDVLAHALLHARGLRCVREDAAREHAHVGVSWLVLDRTRY